VTATKAAAKRRAGRRKGSGARAAQALSLVQGQPGITIPELAAKMSIKQNYLYRVLPGLEQENKVEKKGRGWYSKG
jgi:DNA-binding IclR family transcriptional regulator